MHVSRSFSTVNIKLSFVSRIELFVLNLSVLNFPILLSCRHPAKAREQRGQPGRLPPEVLASGGGAPATLMQICPEYTCSNFYGLKITWYA